MASTLVALQTVTVGAGGTSVINFTNIPQTYTDLVIKASVRSSDATTNDGANLYINGNTSAALYSFRRLTGNGTAAASDSSSASFRFLNVDGNSATANTFGNLEMTIPNYTLSNQKSVSVDMVSENNATSSFQGLAAALWSRTDPITSIEINSGGNTFLQYSTFTLYGVYKDAAETTPTAPTIGTATAGSQAADVAFTPAGSGAPASSYVVTSSPGGLTATGGSSPIQIGGLTSGTAYTFTVRGQNPGGLGAASAASNSVTPYDGYESIATLYPTGATAEFTSIPSTYTHLQIRYIARTSRADITDWIEMNFNSDTGNNYSYHFLRGNGSVTLASAGTSTNYAEVGTSVAQTGGSNMFGVAVVDILDYANTNKFKTVRSLSGEDRNGEGLIYLYSSSWRSTNAINTIVLTPGAGTNFSAGTVIELYGIRG